MAFIYKRGKYWWIGYIEGGKSVQKSLRVTSKDAARTLLTEEYQIIEARERHQTTKLILKRTLKEAIEEFKENTGHGQSNETVRERKGALKRFEEYLAGRELEMREVSHHIVEGYHNKRLRESVAGANKDLKVIKTFLNYAVKRGYLRSNPAQHVKKAKTVKKIFRDLSFDEVGTFLMVAMHLYPNLYPVIAALYYLGMRKNELVYLEWDDVDFDKNVVRVRSKPENRIKDCEERNIPINKKLRVILRALPRGNRFVFLTESGKPWKNNLYRELQKIVADAGLRDVNIQTMRETFGSHLLKRGVSIYLVSKYLGHSSVDVTTRHYAHVPIEDTHKEIDLL